MEMFSDRKWGDPVRVKASFSSHSKRVDGHVVPEYRRFSLDPQLTTFEILRSLISRAFDIQSEFLIQYRFEDQAGQEIFLQLLSDWDLEAAFDRASDPYLCLRVDACPLEQTVEEWDLINVPPGEYKVVQSKEMRADHTLQTKILTKVEKTISLMQQALNFNGTNSDEFADGVSTSPLTDSEFIDYRDGVGTLIKVEKCKQRIFQGGLEPSLRRVVWKHLLNVYPEGLNGSERMKYMSRKTEEYQRLKNEWMIHYTSKKMSEELKTVTGMVKKDVLRTDRQHPFYAGGDDNPNIEQLFNILTTYSIYHPSTGYCQGMSDMASPILYVMGNESHAYIAFTALMERLKENFTTTGATMTMKFEHLASALAYHDPVFFSYLQKHHAIDLLFCYRWLLLEMKREFAFDEALRMLEVTWSSLSCKPRYEELPLFERIPELNPVSQPIPLPRLKESIYTKVCALRRQSSSPASCSPSSTYDPTINVHSLSDTYKTSYQSMSVGSANRNREIDLDGIDTHPADDGNQLDFAMNSLHNNPKLLQNSSSITMDSIRNESQIISSDILPTNRRDKYETQSIALLENFRLLNETDDSEIRKNVELIQSSEVALCMNIAATSKNNSTTDSVREENIQRNEEKKEEATSLLEDFEVIGSCEEATESVVSETAPLLAEAVMSVNPPLSQFGGGSSSSIRPSLPPPDVLGCGNPFLIFLCLTVLLQHRDFIMSRSLDSTSLAMHFDRLVRKHNVERVLSQARTLYYRYLNHFNTHKSRPDESPKRNLVGV